MTEVPAVRIEGVVQAFRDGFWLGRKTILHELSFEVKPNSIIGLLGPNGAGKTTLIHLITGLRRPVAGKVEVFGQSAWEKSARREVGYLPERPYFYEHLTGRRFLQHMATLSGMGGKEVESRIFEVLSLVGLGDAGDVSLRHYSKGMLQRIGIAQAIVHSPRLLILDEPMSGLDPLGRKEMRELIRRLSNEGHTILFSTHIIPDVEAICDQVVILKEGRLERVGPIWDFLGDRPGQTEVAIGGMSEGEVKKLSKDIQEIHVMPDGVRIMAPSQTVVNQILKKVLGGKGQVLWVNPIRPTLEDFFNSTAGGDR